VRIRILLADDSELARAAIKLLLADRTDWEICAEATNGEEAVEKADIACPDLVILDITMPRMNGIQAARKILQHRPNTIVLTDSVHDVRTVLIDLQDAGVRGFVSKASIGSDLIPAIETILKGGTCFPAGTKQTA
jgi:DNA-binding NarL/FixJ family response regulator